MTNLNLSSLIYYKSQHGLETNLKQRDLQKKRLNLMISNLTRMNCKLYKTDELINKPLQHSIGMNDHTELMADKDTNECLDAPYNTL